MASEHDRRSVVVVSVCFVVGVWGDTRHTRTIAHLVNQISCVPCIDVFFVYFSCIAGLFFILYTSKYKVHIHKFTLDCMPLHDNISVMLPRVALDPNSKSGKGAKRAAEKGGVGT